MPIHKRPRVVFAILADSHKAAEKSKLDAFGIFSKFLVWATPATREFSIVAALDHLPVGETEFEILIRSKARPVKIIASFKCNSATNDAAAQAAVRLTLTLTKVADYEIGVRSKGGTASQTRWIPFSVELQPWPELPQGERLEAILSDPQSIKLLRAILTCPKCNKKFTFELNIDPNAKRSRGIRPFPTGGAFKCPKCLAIHQLKDIEGQFRLHLSQQAGGPKQ